MSVSKPPRTSNTWNSSVFSCPAEVMKSNIRATPTTKSNVFDINYEEGVSHNPPKLFLSPSRKFYNKETKIIDIPGPDQKHQRLKHRPADSVVLQPDVVDYLTPQKTTENPNTTEFNPKYDNTPARDRKSYEFFGILSPGIFERNVKSPQPQQTPLTARERHLDQQSSSLTDRAWTPSTLKKKLVDVFNIEACENKAAHCRSKTMGGEENFMQNMRDKNRSSKIFGNRRMRRTDSKNKYDGTINTRFSNTKFGNMLRASLNKIK